MHYYLPMPHTCDVMTALCPWELLLLWQTILSGIMAVCFLVEMVLGLLFGLLLLCSLSCGIMIFCNVFSVLETTGYDRQHVISVLKENGPANTGLTFIWYVKSY